MRSPKRPPIALLASLLVLSLAGPTLAQGSGDAQPAAAPADLADAAPPSTKAVDRTHARYELQGVEIRGNLRTRDRVILRYLPYRAGDLLDVDDPEIELARYRLLGTGFFSSVSLSLKKGSRRGAVVLVVDVVERNTIVVNELWMGLAADADKHGNARPLTAYGGVDVAETNLAGTGIALGAAIGLAQEQLALRTKFLDPAFLGTRWMTSATLLYNDARDFFGHRDVLYVDEHAVESVKDYAVVRYKRFGGSIGAGHDLSSRSQLFIDYRLEQIDADLPLAASHRRGFDIEPIAFDMLPGKSVLSTVRGSLIVDTRDQPILPTRGIHAMIHTDLAMAPLGSDYAFTKVQLRASRWFPLPWKHVARLELFAGMISGDAPFFERFYIGDFTDLLPNRVLDLNTDRRPAPNFLGTDIGELRYGDYAAKIQGEYRIPLYRGRRAVYGIDVFSSAGLYGIASARDLKEPPRGYEGLRRIPVDLTFNLGFRMDTNAGGFVFAFSNVFGFIPIRGEARP